MSAKHNGFEGPLPSSIKLGGFHCHRRGGCDRDALCEEHGGCLSAESAPADEWDREASWREGEPPDTEPPLTIEWRREVTCEAADQYPGAAPAAANASGRSRLDDLAELVLGLTYAEMLEFADSLTKARGHRKMNRETLPKILHAWTRKMAAGSGRDLRDGASPLDADGAARAEAQSIDTAPQDRPVLAFMMGRWRIARWNSNHPHKRPVPFWSADDLRVTVSRAHQPQWWVELPAAPPEAEA